MIYFDTSYIVRLYLQDPGFEKVRALAATDQVACSIHGRAESVAAFHRKFREGAITQAEFGILLNQFNTECEAGAFQWLPLSPAVVARVTSVYRTLTKSVPLRAGDAIHLGCASENQFKGIYSNDEKMLAASAHFGQTGINVI